MTQEVHFLSAFSGYINTSFFSPYLLNDTKLCICLPARHSIAGVMVLGRRFNQNICIYLNSETHTTPSSLVMMLVAESAEHVLCAVHSLLETKHKAWYTSYDLVNLFTQWHFVPVLFQGFYHLSGVATFLAHSKLTLYLTSGDTLVC